MRDISVFCVILFTVSSWGQTATGNAKTSGKCSPATTGNNNTYYFRY
jgi:hypothetical protein